MSDTHNLAAFNAQRQYNIGTSARVKTTEKLSSGYKINRAADDAAGLAISEKMRLQIRGLDQGSENIQDGISLVQTADGALQEVNDMLQRINELSIQAANGTNSDSDRYNINQEIQALKSEMNRVFESTTFNERRIWDNRAKLEKTGEIITEHTDTDAAVVFNECGTTSTIDDNNRGAVPYTNISVKAFEDGLVASWTGYDGINYKSDVIPWDEKLSGSHSFTLSEHMDYSKYPAAQGIDFIYR
ncbi:MAG: hypothetical protein K6F99_03060, partial [Lachnospiraceae bacterium]|nr:hypothetical protein [Lachnospiraceae bacterium]